MKRFNLNGQRSIIPTQTNQEICRPSISKKASALGFSTLSLTLISLLTLSISISAFNNSSWASWEVPNRFHWPSLHQAGEEAYLLKNLPEAEKQLQKARFELDTFGQFNPDLAKTLNILGLVYLEEGRYSESEKYFKRALTIRERQLPATHPDIAITLFNLSELYRLMGLNKQSEASLQKAQAIDPRVVEANEVTVSFSSPRLTTLESFRDANNSGTPGERDSGFDGKFRPRINLEKGFLSKLTLFGDPADPYHVDTATRMTQQGLVSLQHGKLDKALNLFYRSLYLVESQYNRAHPQVAKSINNLGVVHLYLGNLSLGEKLLRESLGLQRNGFGLGNPDTLKTYQNLKSLLIFQGRLNDAEKLTNQMFPTTQEANTSELNGPDYGFSGVSLKKPSNSNLQKVKIKPTEKKSGHSKKS